MISRKLIGYGAGVTCVSLFLLNDFLCTHPVLDSLLPEQHSCPSGIHITRVDTRAGESRIGRVNGVDDVWLEVGNVTIQFGRQSSTLVVGVSGNTEQSKTIHHFTGAHESAAVPGVGTFSLENVRPVGVVFGPKDPWAVFCFAPDPAFTVDPPILWRNKLIPGLHPPPHLWGDDDSTPPYYDDPDPASGATTPPAPRNVAPPTTPQSSTAPNAPAADTAEDAGTTTTGGR